MKILKYFYIFILYFLFVKSGELECKNNLLLKYKEVANNLCDSTDVDTPSISFRATCINNIIYTLHITPTASPPNVTLTYEDLNCFTDVSDMVFTNVLFNENAFGGENEKQVAKRLYFINCTFESGEIASSFSKNTTLVSVEFNENSNLKNIFFLNIKYLDTFILSRTSNLAKIPYIDNNLQNPSFHFREIILITEQLMSFNGLNCSRMTIKVINTTENYSGLDFLNTINTIDELNLDFGDNLITFPSIIGSNNNKLKILSISGKFKKPTIGLNIQEGLQEFSFNGGELFNINGALPFLTIPSSLKLFYFGEIGLTIFPNFPINIETILIYKNNFGGLLPDLSSYKNLSHISFSDCGFTGTIPESYCMFTGYLNNNLLTGFWPQCKICYYDYFEESFEGNPSLEKGNCDDFILILILKNLEPGSIAPNLQYNNVSKELIVYGENLGLFGPSSIYNMEFQVLSKQSMFKAIWNETTNGIIPNIIELNFGGFIFKLATKFLKPIVRSITKLGSNYSFGGENFSYNKEYFEVIIGGVSCEIRLITFDIIKCSFTTSTLPNDGIDIKSTIKNFNSNEIISFTANTIDNKTTNVLSCSFECLNGGYCSSTSGNCICDEKYKGINCDVLKTCQNNCIDSNHGYCNYTSESCVCVNGWSGNDCSTMYCSSNCSEPLGNGKCDTTTGNCKCSQHYTSDDCSIPNQYISSVSSVPTSGGVVNIWGWFGTVHTGLSIMIGQQVCQHYINSITSSFINCTVGAGSGTQSITLTQNSITYTGNNIFHYTELTYNCPKDCSNNGKCNTLTGQCKCNSGWGGYDCNSKKTTQPSTSTSSTTAAPSSTTGSTETPTPTSTPIIEIPKSNTTINEDLGSAIINNQQTTYEISILSLIEIDFSNNIVNTFNLSNQWTTSVSTDNIYKFTQTIQETCIITYTIEEIKTEREYQWAGLDLTLDKDSIKISVSIKNYTFNSVLNNLQLRFESLVGDNNKNTQENNECNNKDTEVDTSEIDKNQLLNYVTISRNQKVLYGRFINRVISDSRQTFITTSVIPNNNNNNKQSVIIGLNLPHCTNECLIDPDFSVLVSSSYQECSSDLNNGRASWVLPVAIVVPCVAVAAIVIISAVLYKKNRLSFLIAKNKLNNIKLSKK
ncbi:hypothetical protein ACTFIZ_012436 [Dictyostelium cf. discoideum]